MKSTKASQVILPKVICDGSFYWERIFKTSKYAPHFDLECMRPVVDCDGSFPIKNYDTLSRFDISAATVETQS